MAFVVKYRFKFDSWNGMENTVTISQDGYSGDAIERPLGSAPVIRMQESGPFHATSCALSLECHVDGEFATLYTSNPKEYRVDIYRGSTDVWSGFIATEIYSEPHIAPPYDVKVTATDGLGTLKEYTFEATGPQTLRTHLQSLLAMTGLNLPLNTVSTLRESVGTAIEFMDDELIDIDFLAGENCYDVLGKLLDTLHATITQTRNQWLIIRETDASVSGGSLSVIRSTTRSEQSSTSTTMSLSATVGQMGVAQMWPVGYLTRRISPAKKEITIQSPWYTKSGAPSVSSDGWTHGSNCAFTTNRYTLGSYSNAGSIDATMSPLQFTNVLRVVVKTSRVPNWQYGQAQLGSSFGISVAWYSSTSSSWKYYDAESGTWGTSQGTGSEFKVDSANEAHDVSFCESHEVLIPAADDSGVGFLKVAVYGLAVDIYDVAVDFDLGPGYQDHIVITNGARGGAGTTEILGGRRTASNGLALAFLAGVWYGGPSTSVPTFSDSVSTAKDFMSLTAMSYAKSVAFRRIETTGTLDVPGTMTFAPLIIYHASVYSLMQTYEWDLLHDELNFKALSFPEGTLVVDSETVTSIPSGGSSSSSSSSGGGGGGGGIETESDPVFSASPAATISLQDISDWSSHDGTVKKVEMQVPTGFSVTGTPITTQGKFVVSYATGYSLPTNTKQGQWDSAYGAMHTHSNKAVLDGITPQKVSDWDSAASLGGAVDVSIGGTAAAPTVAVAIGQNNDDSVALPMAGANAAGIVSTGAQVFSGHKTFDRLYIGDSQAYGMYIEWDSTNLMFKIVGDAYVTGDIAAGGVS